MCQKTREAFAAVCMNVEVYSVAHDSNKSNTLPYPVQMMGALYKGKAAKCLRLQRHVVKRL